MIQHKPTDPIELIQWRKERLEAIIARKKARGTTTNESISVDLSPEEYFAAFDAKVLAAHNEYMKKFNEDK